MTQTDEKIDPVQTIKDMLKIPPKGEYTCFKLELVDPANNSDKFYTCKIKQAQDGKFQLIAIYGRNGTSGKSELKHVGTESSCRAQAKTLQSQKIKKGYSSVNWV